MSGSGLSPWALVENPARYAQQVAHHANCSPDLPQPHLLKCLRERPLDVLLATPIEAPEFSTAFGPSIDGVVIDNGEPPGGGGGGSSNNADSSSRYGDYMSGSGNSGNHGSSSSSSDSEFNTLNSVL
jgi:neuroligin